MTVRVCLIMIILLNLHNKQIDYTAAFLQAPFDHDVYVGMPKMFTSPGKVWLLKRALYGLKDAPRAYFIHTKTGWKISGFDNQMLTHVFPFHLQLLYFVTVMIAYYYTKMKQQSIF